MENFTYKNPTKLIFGKNTVKELKKEIPQYGSKVLLVYGGGSIKDNGIYGQVMEQLTTMDAVVFELPGVEPNPRLSTARKGVEICKKENIDFLLAVGGGSVIDCTKTIAGGALYEGDVWDLITKKDTLQKALPFGTVLTLAATGSEMNSGAVITNWETNEKYGWGSPLLFPKFSILDPINTFSVPRNQTVYGIVDMMTHVLEQYFHEADNTPLQERMCESVLKTVIETAPKLLNDLENYEYRETILYSGTIALNGTLQMGLRGDWASHNIEHAVSAVYDIPHAGGLAILFPLWMSYNLEEGKEKASRLAVRAFDVDPAGKTDYEIAEEGIRCLRSFWDELGAPSRLADYEIDDTMLDKIANHAMFRGEFGNFRKLNRDDVIQILQSAL
jgi:alcohol dehydrogenase YqhD (iron-dependent ADH family)